jgi:lactate dehydrogenase-like 2-hydroxyacid dehydrogenase
MPFKILIITPTNHINNFKKNFGKNFLVRYFEDITESDFVKIASKYDAIYTNPNKLKFYLGPKNIKNFKNLKVICTASTGTDHIDLKYFRENGVKILSLTKDYTLLRKLSATAELAFAFTLLSTRDIINSSIDVKNGIWDYTKFIGNQLNSLKIGVLGYGRLGKKFAKYCKAFDADVHVYDPYKKIPNKYTKVKNLKNIFKNCDLISLHLHLNEKTKHLISHKYFKIAKKNLKLINTSRGGIVNENDVISFLQKNKFAKYFSDVIENEYQNIKKSNKIIKCLKKSKQLVITPHIGGMTKESQELAFNFAAQKLSKFLKKY